MQYLGQCFCGNVKFEAQGDPIFTQHCHCNKCREIAALSQNEKDKIGYGFTAAYLRENFIITEGQDHLAIYPRNSSDLFLCMDCKSHIYGMSQDPAKQAGIGVNANNFVFTNGLPASFEPEKHIFYADRTVDVDDELPKYTDAPKEQFGTGELL